MYKAWNRVENKVIYGTWEDVCDLDKRWYDVSEVTLDADGEEVPKTKNPLVSFNVRTKNGGTRKLEVFNVGDLGGIYIGNGGES